MTTLHYQITPNNLNSHLFSVQLSFTSQVEKNYTLSLPAWLPGSYMIRDFAKNITEISAINSKGQPIPLNKLDKQTWQLIATDETITVNYQVFAFDLSVRTAYLDNQRGFFNGSSTFLQVPELDNSRCKLMINSPHNEKNWRVATGLTRSSHTDKYSFGEYIAEDYNELIDCPVAIGEFDSVEFMVEGVIHHMVFTSQHFGDREQLSHDVKKLCQHHINLFGGAPFKEYWFITHLLENGFGGLEHKNSTILQASRFDLPNPNKINERSDNYKKFLSLCSHEYFHAWNVCRIKPKEFTPYNLQEEIYTNQLWAYEGITSYYDDFSLYRTGLITFDEYLMILAQTATRVYRGKGELKQTVAESSFDTWTKFYQQGPDAVNNIVSYYTKGSLIALWLDLTIRDKSQGQFSLDTLMRELWLHFGQTSIGTQEDDFINIANILCKENITEDFKKLLHSPARIDLSSLLNSVGIKFTYQKFEKLNELITTPSDSYQGYLGAQYQDSALGVKIKSVIEDSPAANAGLAVNDVLIAVHQTKASVKSLQALADHLPQNTKVSCHYFRDDQLLNSEIKFTDSPLRAVGLTLVDQEKAKLWQKIIN